MIDDSTQHIARISYGKDSLKMLEVIKSRGLPLDRITTTDVWATDTISANLPPMQAFKDRMDQRIWDMYHIQVEHLCALNPDGTKKTYEQMFYHIPERKNSQSVQVERKFAQGSITGFPILGRPWCQSELKRRAYRVQGSITGFPPNTGYNWCQKLKIVTYSNQGIPHGKRGHMVPETQNRVQTPGIPGHYLPMVQKTQDRQGQNTPFLPARPDGLTEISWNTWVSLLTSLPGLVSLTPGSVRRWWSSASMKVYAACTASTTTCFPPPTKPLAVTAAGSATTRV